MGMDRILERLSEGAPPLRVSEFADLIGYSAHTIRKLVAADAIRAVRLVGTIERRIPVQEALRLARELRILR
jgi:excisionase family DNA binding protein